MMRSDRRRIQGTDWRPGVWLASLRAGVAAPLTAVGPMVFTAMVNAGVLLWARCEWRRQWGFLSLLVVLVAVGGGVAVAAAAAARRTETAFSRMLEATNQPNLGVLGAGDEGFFDLDPALLDRVMQIDGVKGVAQFAFIGVAPDGFANFFALALIDRRGDAPRSIWLEGTEIEQFNTMRADEVVLNESMRNQLSKGAGDAVVLRSLTQEQFDASLSQETEMAPGGPTVNARIAGVIRSPEDVSDAPDPFLILPPAFYDKYHDVVGGCLCNVLINADPQAIDAVMAKLVEIYPRASIEPAEDFAGRIADSVALQRRAWWVISLAAAMAGVVSLFQASTRAGRILSTGDEARRALGTTLREQRLGRLLVITPPIVLGAAGALGVAYALSPIAPVGLTRLAEPAPGLRWEPAVVIPGVVIVLVVSVVAAGVAAITARRTVGRLGAAGRLGGPQLAFGTRLALGPGRGAIVGVLLSTAGLVAAFTLEHSIDHVLATPALYGADFDAGNFLDSGADKRAMAEQLTPDPDIDAVSLVWTQLPTASPVHVVGPGGEVGADPNAYENIKGTVSIKQTRGRAPGRVDEVAVGRAMMDQLGAKVGERIAASGSKGTAQLTIVGDNLDPGVDVAGQGFALTLDGLTSLVDATIQGTVVRFTIGTDHAALIDRYPDLDLTPMTPPSEVGHIGQLGGLPGRVGQLLTFLGIAALINAIALTVRLGRREVALHRALGFTSTQVAGAHLWQAVITAFTGSAIGLGVGLVAARAIHRELVTNVGAVPESVVPGAVWLVALGALAACLAAAAATTAVALRRGPGAELRAE
jgi:putative ABC transport system permease protein